MPTILELFKGSSKDITPKKPDETPIAKVFPNSTQDKSVHSDQTNLVKQELSGIRLHSLVELNNPLIYGNEAIRIATRSTSAVEQMKQATGGTAGDGGLIGKGLGKLTEGKFGKFVFGGKVTSLSQARDGVNSRLGIPQNVIPTYVNNTGELQKGIEPNTMVTLGKIRDDAKGTDFGKFLKQTGGGNPKTLGTQILGGGISFVKDKLRTKLFGDPNSLGANNSSAIDSFSGVYSGGKSTTAWEYSSNLPYSKQISNVKFNTKAIDGYVEGTSKDITKKITQLQLDAKAKLGEASANVTLALKNKLKNSNSKSELDKFLDDKNAEKKEIVKPSYDTPYEKTIGDYKKEGGDEKMTRIDLSLVSPIYGVDRQKTKGVYGKSEYAFGEIKNATGLYSPYNPTQPFSKTNTNKLEKIYGITSNNGDAINKTMISPFTKDLIPVWMSSINDGASVQFRAVLTGFTETVSPSWDSSKFVGNPMPFWTYSGVERSASFQLKLYCQNEEELAMMWEKINFLTKKAYPTIVDKLVEAPFIKLTLGSIYSGKVGFINSLSYTVEDDVTWETQVKGLWLPKIVNVQIEFKLVEMAQADMVLYNYAKSTAAQNAINSNRQMEAEQSKKNSDATQANLNKTNGTPNSTSVSGAPVTGGRGILAKALPVKSIDTARNITPMAGLSDMKLPTITPNITPAPPKVDALGNEQTEPPSSNSTKNSGGMVGMSPASQAEVKANSEQTKGGVDSTPKSIDTGKPATDTPKQKTDPATATAIAISGESKKAEEMTKAKEKYSEYPEWVRSIFAYHESDGRKLDQIKKLNETAFYFEWTDTDEDTYEQVAHANLNADGTFQNNNISNYSRWCTKFNDGKDPLNKYFHNKDGKIASKAEMDAFANSAKPSNQLGF
jgi:hypothetical protein